MKIAILCYRIKRAEISGLGIADLNLRKDFLKIINCINNGDVSEAEKIAGNFVFSFDVSLSDQPNSCAIEPCDGVFFDINKDNSTVTIGYSGGLLMGGQVRFPVIVADFFESIDDLNDYIAYTGMENSCWISSLKFGGDWCVNSDFGFELCALKISKRTYRNIPAMVQNYYCKFNLKEM